MNRYTSLLLPCVLLLNSACSHKSDSVALPTPTAFGAAIVESSGGKQIAQTGALLPQPLVVQVNDERGTAVAGALVRFSAVPGVTLDPRARLPIPAGK